MNRAYLHSAVPPFEPPFAAVPDFGTEIIVGTNALRLDVQDGLLIVTTMDARIIWIPLSNVRLIQ